MVGRRGETTTRRSRAPRAVEALNPKEMILASRGRGTYGGFVAYRSVMCKCRVRVLAARFVLTGSRLAAGRLVQGGSGIRKGSVVRWGGWRTMIYVSTYVQISRCKKT